jgi:hypothetical protein
MFFTYGLADPVIVIYNKSEEGKAFVHANCYSSERKRPYSRVLYLVFFPP